MVTLAHPQGTRVWHKLRNACSPWQEESRDGYRVTVAYQCPSGGIDPSDIAKNRTTTLEGGRLKAEFMKTIVPQWEKEAQEKGLIPKTETN